MTSLYQIEILLDLHLQPSTILIQYFNKCYETDTQSTQSQISMQIATEIENPFNSKGRPYRRDEHKYDEW